MAYVTGYNHDVFISYAHIDNEPIGAGDGWISIFASHLKKFLDKGLGCKDASIWMDHELTGNEVFSTKIEEALRESATLLVIASPSYVSSKWCARERNAFLDSVREKSRAGSRIFRVDIDKLKYAELPTEFGELLGYTFWALDAGGNPRTLGHPIVDPKGEPEYFTALNKLRTELGSELKRLRQTQSESRTSARSQPAIFLAEVTDDLEEYREEIDTYAKQYNLRVLPEKCYPRDDPAEYARRMAVDLAQSKSFVQLLSEWPGKKPLGWPSRLAAVQLELARKAKCPILQWRSRGVDLEKVKSSAPEHFNLLIGEDVQACAIEEFKRAVVEGATRQPEPKRPASQGILVFVNSDLQDRPFAAQVCQLLADEGIGYSMPLMNASMKPTEYREDLELNLSTCDGLIVVYGSTPVTWVRRQLAEGHKILSQRNEPRPAVWLVEGPPPDKQPPDFLLPNMRSLNCHEGVRREIVSELVATLQG
ncbi:toll/interleukin-1 receptor domain-containing protein [Paraburkholderia nodosa]|uniref:toll/interleukin-1 receptor domain-containing protein n=1 Tax=Paraburkholderia nodosa TaxID=392320 RepID=UPI0004B23E56|nr:toll/interleukin-1 receptor domain-containing protein [Paraburkholderia nodosa]